MQGAKEESRGEEAGGAPSSLANLLLPALILIAEGARPNGVPFLSVLRLNSFAETSHLSRGTPSQGVNPLFRTPKS